MKTTTEKNPITNKVISTMTRMVRKNHLDTTYTTVIIQNMERRLTIPEKNIGDIKKELEVVDIRNTKKDSRWPTATCDKSRKLLQQFTIITEKKIISIHTILEGFMFIMTTGELIQLMVIL